MKRITFYKLPKDLIKLIIPDNAMIIPIILKTNRTKERLSFPPNFIHSGTTNAMSKPITIVIIADTINKELFSDYTNFQSINSLK